jgi:hypothetical protein
MVQESDTLIRTAFEKILSNYLLARFQPFGREHDLWEVFVNVCDRFQEYISSRSTLKVRWGVGKGNWARIPWIAFLDANETDTTQHGVYPVYLFREDMSGVYITFNQGVTRLKEKHGTPESRRILRQRAEQLLLDPTVRKLEHAGFSLDDKINLHTSRGLGKDYEVSTIAYKLYRKGEIPSDDRILRDLEEVLLAYDQYLELQPFREPEIPVSVAEPAPPQTNFDLASAIQEVNAYINDRGFVYEPWQIAQYITAIRTKPFVILAGITGTGKSKLPALIAEATGGESKLVPVRPDWTDSADVLGYTDLQGTFRPGPVLEIAHDAAANTDQFSTCIIDEMNLARVEQYFAEVLSRIEDRHLLANGGYSTAPLLGQTLNEADAEWGEVVLPANLAIVGTVNMDESTHGFSRKVLDRAFTIELSEINLELWNTAGVRSNRTASTWPVKSWYPLSIQLSELVAPTAEQLEEINRTIVELQTVNDLLSPAQLQVGYRTRDEVAFFLLHAQQISAAFVDREGRAVDPLDLALQMKILPRIVGGSNAIRRCVFSLLGWAITGNAAEAEEEINSRLEAWETSGRPSSLNESKYPRLAARLCLMWQRLEADGYTSYWL